VRFCKPPLRIETLTPFRPVQREIWAGIDLARLSRSAIHDHPARRHTISQLLTVVPRAADDREDGAAAAWRNARSVEHLHGVLPVDAARRVSVRGRRDAMASTPSAGRAARDAACRLAPPLADRPGHARQSPR